MTKNFSIEEFNCNDGTKMPLNVFYNMQKVANQLQILRNYLGKPITINSGYRSEEYNASIKGSSKKSHHIMGRAADIVVKGLDPVGVYATIELLIEKGDMLQGGLGIYPNNGFVHYDIRGEKIRWRK
tara:strand:+ start:17873 stop:18253 length:381 start_codon:yes stop_codon:yes gene_type:complete